MNVSGMGASSATSMMQEMRSRMFAKVDQDGSGGLNVDEFKAMAGKAPKGAEGVAQDVEAQFAKIDADGDGNVTQAELESGATSARESMRSTVSMAGGLPPMGGGGMPPMGGPPPGHAAGCEAERTTGAASDSTTDAASDSTTDAASDSTTDAASDSTTDSASDSTTLENTLQKLLALLQSRYGTSETQADAGALSLLA